ncbi:MAG: hypothetical protein ABFD81_09290 [Syntrophaceae bacterium]
MQTQKNISTCLWIAVFLLCGCNGDSSSDSDTDSTYENMTSSYTIFTVESLWEALDDDTDDNGSYIMLKGVLHSVGDQMVTLIDSDTDKTVTCTFTSTIDLSSLETVLANTGSDGADVVTIAGICHFYTEGTSYPYLDQCDYYYVNKDG